MVVDDESEEEEEEEDEAEELLLAGEGSDVPPAMLRMRPRVMRSWTRRKCLVVRKE